MKKSLCHKFATAYFSPIPQQPPQLRHQHEIAQEFGFTISAGPLAVGEG
jgi:hypothetical protein